MTNARRFLMGTVVAVALAAPAIVLAEGEATFGTQWWTQDNNEALYQQFRVVPQGGLLEAFLLREQSGPYSWFLTGTHALQDDQAYRMAVHRSRWRLDLGYTGIPHLYSQVARSPYAQIAPGVFVLPDSLQRTNQEYPNSYPATMKNLLDSSPRIPLDLQTDVSTARLRGRAGSDWRFDLKGRRIQRSGQKPYAGTFGFSSAIELPEPIDQTTTDVDGSIDWHHSRVKVMASGGASMFENDIERLVWDNPQRYTNIATGSVLGQLALAPDNLLVRGNVGLGVDLPQRSTLTASVGVSQSKQNEKWLPLTANPAIVQKDSLPGKSPDAKANILHVDARLASYAVPKLRGALRVGYDDYDNQTREVTFVGQAVYDQSFNGADVTTDADSHKQLVAGLDLDYEIANGVSVGGLLEHRTRERTHREVEKDGENVYGGTLRIAPAPEFEIRGRYKRGERKADAFLDEDYQDATGAFVEQPGLRRFDVADRTRDDAGATVLASWGERAEVTADFGYLKNDYTKSQLGLEDDTQYLIATEGTLHLNEAFDLNGGYTFGQVVTNQKSRESGAVLVSGSDTTSWTAEITDKSNYYFASLDWKVKESPLGLSLGYDATRTLADFDLGNFKQTAVDVPSTYQLRQDLSVTGRWKTSDKLSLELRYALEKYDVEDFSTKNVPLVFPVSGSVTAIYLGDSVQDYIAHRVALVARYGF